MVRTVDTAPLTEPSDRIASSYVFVRIRAKEVRNLAMKLKNLMAKRLVISLVPHQVVILTISAEIQLILMVTIHRKVSPIMCILCIQMVLHSIRILIPGCSPT